MNGKWKELQQLPLITTHEEVRGVIDYRDPTEDLAAKAHKLIAITNLGRMFVYEHEEKKDGSA